MQWGHNQDSFWGSDWSISVFSTRIITISSGMRHFNIMTWIATGIMSSSSNLSAALNEHSADFCGISEHWLCRKDLHFSK